MLLVILKLDTELTVRSDTMRYLVLRGANSQRFQGLSQHPGNGLRTSAAFIKLGLWDQESTASSVAQPSSVIAPRTMGQPFWRFPKSDL